VALDVDHRGRLVGRAAVVELQSAFGRGERSTFDLDHGALLGEIPGRVVGVGVDAIAEQVLPLRTT
jgi:hypothetical protein